MNGDTARSQPILVTGCAGYIGSTLVRLLLQSGYQVRGIDSLAFGGESLLGVLSDPGFTFIRGDIRDSDTLARAVDGVMAVVHLAAIVGDPACAALPEEAEQINWLATKNLVDLSLREASVERFIFASTCSNYGKMKGVETVNETSALRPVSLYAKQKVRVEEYLSSLDASSISVTSLRFSTVYGCSSRMRFDLTVNEFVKELALGRELLVFGEQFWRPYCHVFDIGRACLAVLEAERSTIAGGVFGVGDSEENYQKSMIVNEIVKFLPDSVIKTVAKDEDPRDYRVDFSLIKDTLGFQVSRRLPDGIKEVLTCVRDKVIQDPDHQRYKNL